MKEREESGIEKARERLYRRDFRENPPGILPEFYSEAPNVPENWKQKPPAPREPEREEKKPTMFQKLFIFSLAFFFFALAVAAYFFSSGGNVVSSENVDISVIGPVSVAGGDELSLQVVITNENPAPLLSADLLIEYADGAYDAENPSKELPRDRVFIGTIRPGETVNEIVRAVVFGEEESKKNIRIALEYRIEGSNAILSKETEYAVTISSAPLSVDVDMLSEVGVGQETDIVVSVMSNSDTPLAGTLLRVDYPFGFEPTDFSVPPSYGTNIWDFGTLDPSERVSVRITGVIKAQDNEDRIFGIAAGRADETDERKMAVVYTSVFRQVTVKKPFLGVDVRIGGESKETYAIDGGRETIATIVWRNNTPGKIVDASIEASFSGEALDPFSVRADQGFYRSDTNRIVWNKSTNEELSEIAPGETGRVTFRFAAFDLLRPDMSSVRNPEIRIAISVTGRRIGEEGAVEEVNEAVERKVVVNSAMRVSARALYRTGPFQNTGPLPPRAGETTTYTILFALVNSSNDVSGATVRAVLPPNVSFAGRVSPAGEKITYRKETGEIVWHAGFLPSGTGVSRPVRQAAINVSFIPSVSQIGSQPPLARDIIAEGTDTFTGEKIRSSFEDVTTFLSADPSFRPEEGAVAK